MFINGLISSHFTLAYTVFTLAHFSGPVPGHVSSGHVSSVVAWLFGCSVVLNNRAGPRLHYLQ